MAQLCCNWAWTPWDADFSEAMSKQIWDVGVGRKASISAFPLTAYRLRNQLQTLPCQTTAARPTGERRVKPRPWQAGSVRWRLMSAWVCRVRTEGPAPTSWTPSPAPAPTGSQVGHTEPSLMKHLEFFCTFVNASYYCVCMELYDT